MRLPGALLCILSSLPVGAAPARENVPLAKAEGLIEGLRYPEAARELDAALAVRGNSRETLLRALWLKGMVQAILGNAEAAQAPLRVLAVLAPDFSVEEGQPTRVMTAWYEARGWAEGNLTLRLEALAGSPGQVRVQVPQDVLKLARGVRFYLVEDGVPRSATVNLIRGQAGIEVRGREVRWWAELLGEVDAVLFELASAAAPLSAEGRSADAPVSAVAPEPAPATPEAVPPVVSAQPPPAVAEAPPSAVTPAEPAHGHPLRWAGLGAGAAAAICLGLGVWQGNLSRSQAARVTDAPRAADGALLGISQRDADQLLSDARTRAIAANLLFAGAGVAAAAGIVLWIADWRLAVSPAPGGLVLAGATP